MLMNENLDKIPDNKISSPDIRIHDKYRNKVVQSECHQLLAQGTYNHICKSGAERDT